MNAAERLAAALTFAADRLVYVYGDSENVDFIRTLRDFAADPTIARDMELGAALNSDKAERVLAEAIYAVSLKYDWANKVDRGDRTAEILAALREGLAEPEQPDDETIARVMGKVGRLDVDD